jgi:hypothetical protein
MVIIIPFPSKEDWSNPDYCKMMIERKRKAKQPIPDNWPEHVRVMSATITEESKPIVEANRGEIPETTVSIREEVEKALGGPVPKDNAGTGEEGQLPRIKHEMPSVKQKVTQAKDKVNVEELDIPFDVIGAMINETETMKASDKKIDTSIEKCKQLNRLLHRAFPDLRFPPIWAFAIALFSWLAPAIKAFFPKLLDWGKKNIGKIQIFGNKKNIDGDKK